MTSTSDWAVESALTAHPRSPGEQVPRLAVGDSLQTGVAARRRVELPDGSALYLNRNTDLTLETPKRISLDQGENLPGSGPSRRRRDTGGTLPGNRR